MLVEEILNTTKEEDTEREGMVCYENDSTRSHDMYSTI